MLWASLVAQTLKRLPAMRETQVQSLGQEDSLEKEMAIHSSTIAWKIPWTEEPGKLQSMRSQRIRHDFTFTFTFTFTRAEHLYYLCANNSILKEMPKKNVFSKTYTGVFTVA